MIQQFKMQHKYLLNYKKMITKYNQFNESITHYLKGPSVEQVWKHYGFDRTYTSEEFFHYLTDDIEVISPNGLYYEWIKDGNIVFEQYYHPEKLIFMKYKTVFKIYEKIFNMDFVEFMKFMKEMFNKYFSDKIDINEYQIRIEYMK